MSENSEFRFENSLNQRLGITLIIKHRNEFSWPKKVNDTFKWMVYRRNQIQNRCFLNATQFWGKREHITLRISEMWRKIECRILKKRSYRRSCGIRTRKRWELSVQNCFLDKQLETHHSKNNFFKEEKSWTELLRCRKPKSNSIEEMNCVKFE